MIRFYKTRPVKSPSRGTALSAGLDFYIPDDYPAFSLLPGQDVLIPSGIVMQIPPDTMLIGVDKSGVSSSASAKDRAGLTVKLGAHDSCIVVGAKLIDADYPGEIHIHLINVGYNVVNFEPGQKVAQFVEVPIRYDTPIEVKRREDLDIPTTERSGGFGSTGSI